VQSLLSTKHLLLLVAFALSACSQCADEVVHEATSPSGATKAVFFVRNCGATTDYASSVCIISPGAKVPKDHGIVFTADSNHGAAPLQPNGALPISVTWVDSDHLRITYDSRARVFRSERLFKDVHIEYSPKT
jgi:hypothetical protein